MFIDSYRNKLYDDIFVVELLCMDKPDNKEWTNLFENGDKR